jgi:MFS family permease
VNGWRQLLLLDIAPLSESRSFRLLWIGQLISVTGSQVRLVALPYQIFLLTGSSFAVGLIGVFQAVPLLLLGLFGGAIADAMDRRRLLLATQLGLALVSLALAIATQAGLASVPLLYVFTAVGAAFSALDSPTRSSLTPTLVERRHIRAAVALNQSLQQFATVFGAALAGIVIAWFGLAGAYWLDAASFAAAVAAVWRIRTPPRVPAEPQSIVRAVIEGLRYLGATRILLATMSLDFLAMFFGSPRALFPYYADRVFHVGPVGLGLLYASMGAGAFVAAIGSGWTARVQRQGLAILVSVAVWGLAVAIFGVLDERSFALALALLAIANAADIVSTIFRGTMLQLIVPDALRGRLNSINLMFVIGGPQLGQFESGAVAALWSPVASVVTGGVACVASVFAIAAWIPEITRFKVHRDEFATPDQG